MERIQEPNVEPIEVLLHECVQQFTTEQIEHMPVSRTQKQSAVNEIVDSLSVTVKSIPPNTENWLREFYDKNNNNDTSTEEKHETNYSMNNDTRNMHIT